MDIRNKKGVCLLPPVQVIIGTGATAAGKTVGGVVAFKVAWALIAAACIWHIPAWSQAKANHTEGVYQSQQMWPQQFFGTKNAVPSTVGNGGNFTSGNSN